jgi:PPP family 3-phenylpropionic acid transporter
MHYISESVPEAQAGTAQSLYASVTGGIAMGAVMLISGPLYVAYAGRGYWAMALIAVVALAASHALWRGPKSNP